MNMDQYQLAKKLLAEEQGFRPRREVDDFSMVLCYPNTYYLGMSNLGFQTMYYLFNEAEGAYCERAFLPDEQVIHKSGGSRGALLSLESSLPINQFDIVAFSISFELDYLNLLKMLKLGGIPLKRNERNEHKGNFPLIIAGGPCATFNPEPLADFVDIFFLGEGESFVEPFVKTFGAWQKEGEDKNLLLERLSQIPGVYIPAFYETVYGQSGEVDAILSKGNAPAKVSRQWIVDLDKFPVYSHVLTPKTEFGEMFLVEVARGCGRHCRFCMTGYCFRMPRYRSLEKLWETIKSGMRYRKWIGLVGAAVSDYPEIDDLCQLILEEGGKISVASLRADSLTEKLVEALAKSGQKTITLAPEAGSERLRRVINKTISDAQLFRAVDLANIYGIPNVRYYLMVGLPTEQKEDLDAAVELAKATLMRLREKHGNRTGVVTLSITPFVPKPFTPFQWTSMETLEILEEKISYIKKALRFEGGIRVNIESVKWSVIQGVLSRGDRRLGDVLLKVLENGGNFSAWKRALGSEGIYFYAYRARKKEEILPWSHLEMGVTQNFLIREETRAEKELLTDPCQVGVCRACGVCVTD